MLLLPAALCCTENPGLLLFLFCSMLGDKASRGSKWTVLDAGKKYLTMPIYDGAVPEEVSFFLVKLELYSCTYS